MRYLLENLVTEILIEEFLSGEEMSFFILTDGLNIKNFGTAQDHKRVLEGDKGKIQEEWAHTHPQDL